MNVLTTECMYYCPHYRREVNGSFCKLDDYVDKIPMDELECICRWDNFNVKYEESEDNAGE